MIPAPAAASRHELRLRHADFRRIAALVGAFAGIALADGKMALVQARLAKRVRTLGLGSFEAYATLIERDDAAGLAERQELISAITTNVTRFFREPHHFETLRTRVLPDLMRAARRGDRVRLWSAGCSTGEEPYSLAMTVLEVEPDAHRLDVRILASDLDRSVLATAGRGIYPEGSAEAIPRALHRHLVPAGGGEPGVAIASAPRALVAFRQLNLTEPWPMRGRFDVILCRNVVIYFDAAVERAVWRGFAERLAPRGWLFVGHSERVNTLDLPMFESEGVSTYRRV